MESALNSFSKELESEKPNIIAINHYKNTVQLRLEDLEKKTYEGFDAIPAEEQTELIDQLSQFHLQVDDLAQKSMHVSETQAYIPPASTFQTMTANQNPTSLTLKQDVQPMSVSMQPTMKKITDDNRHNRTTATQPQRLSTIIKQLQQTTKRIDKGHCQQHPQSMQLRMPPQITVIPYNLTFGPYLNTLPKMKIESYTGDPLQWSDWRSRFDFMIGNTALSNSQKIAYLQGLVTGKAKDAILHFHCNGQIYNDALRELERKFGKTTTIVNAYIQQLSDYQPPIKGNPESYINYTTFIKGTIRNLQHLEHTADLESTTNLRHAIKELPTSDLIRWQQYIVNRRIDRPNLITFCDWLKPIAEAYELLEDSDNQQLHTLQTFATQTINSK